MLAFATVILTALFTPASEQRRELGTYNTEEACEIAKQIAAVEYVDFTNIDLACTSALAPIRSPRPQRRPEVLSHE